MRKLFLMNMTRLLIHKLKKDKFIPISPFDKPSEKKIKREYKDVSIPQKPNDNKR